MGLGIALPLLLAGSGGPGNVPSVPVDPGNVPSVPVEPSITALANRTGSLSASFGLCLLARVGMVQLYTIAPLGKKPPSYWKNDATADSGQNAYKKTDTEKFNSFVALYGFICPE
jgi:hypothetical protein